MMTEFSDMWDGREGTVRTVKHSLDLDPPEAKHIRSAPYRDGPRALHLDNEEIDKLKSMKLIELAQSEWASPIVLAPKKDGSIRLCIDYSRLNAINIRDSYEIHRMDECIDSLGNAKIF